MKKVGFLLLFLISIVLQSQHLIILIKQGDLQRLNVQKNTWHPINVFDTIPLESSLNFGNNAFLGGISDNGISFEISGSNQTIEMKNFLKGKTPRPLLFPLIKQFIYDNSKPLLATDRIKYYQYIPIATLPGDRETDQNLYNRERDTIMSDRFVIRYNKAFNPVDIKITNYFDEIIQNIHLENDSLIFLKMEDESHYTITFFSPKDKGLMNNQLSINKMKPAQFENLNAEINLFFNNQPKSLNNIDKLLLSFYFENKDLHNEAMMLYEELVKQKTLNQDLEVYYGAFMKRNCAVELK